MSLRLMVLLTAVILVASVIIYGILGGFEKIQYSVHSEKAYKISGRQYTGPNNTAELESIFVELRELAGDVGTLVIVNNEKNLDEENDNVDYFIGVLLNDTPQNLQQDFTTLELSANMIVRARIESHNLVMPKPGKVRNAAIEMAKGNGFDLSEFTVEKYYGEGVIEVDFLSKD